MNLRTTIAASFVVLVCSGQAALAVEQGKTSLPSKSAVTAKPAAPVVAKVKKGPRKWQGKRSTSGLPKFRNVRRVSGLTKSQIASLHSIYSGLKRDSQAIQAELNADKLAGAAVVSKPEAAALNATSTSTSTTTSTSTSTSTSTTTAKITKPETGFPKDGNVPLSEKAAVVETPLSEAKPRLDAKRKAELNNQLASKKNAAWVKVQAVLNSAQKQELQAMRMSKKAPPPVSAPGTSKSQAASVTKPKVK